MTNRVFLLGYAALFGILGLLLLFLPREVADALQLDTSSSLPMQLASAGLLAMATLNRLGRNAVYGGIYGRPIVMANFTFGMVAGGSLVSALLDDAIGYPGWILVTVFVVFVIGVWTILRDAPPTISDQTDDPKHAA